MGKFISMIMKIISGVRSKNSSPPPPAPVPNRTKSEIEDAIDLVVKDCLPSHKNLMKFSSSLIYWQCVFKALAYAESSFNLTERFVETGLGVDAVTGKQNTSEGLLQLSYQDTKYHQCEFDWFVDRQLDVKNSNKTIFNLRLNVSCGMKIMDKLVGQKGTYVFNSGNYWAVLKPNNKRHDVFKTKCNQYLKEAQLEKI